MSESHKKWGQCQLKGSTSHRQKCLQVALCIRRVEKKLVQPIWDEVIFYNYRQSVLWPYVSSETNPGLSQLHFWGTETFRNHEHQVYVGNWCHYSFPVPLHNNQNP